MYPIFLKFGPFTIYAYGVMVTFGFLVGLLISLYFAKKENIPKENIIDLALYILIGGLIGARFFYVLGDWNFYKNYPLEILMIQRGGLAITGGIIATLLVIVWYARRKKLLLLKLLDTVTPGMLLGYSLGRIGCFLNGCCFGLPAKLPWALIFPPPSLAHHHFPGETLHPTQLYSSLSGLVGFLLIFYLYRRKEFPGQIFFWGLLFYSLYRFGVEFFRYSPLHFVGLTPAQWFSLLAFTIAFSYLTVKSFRAKIK